MSLDDVIRSVQDLQLRIEVVERELDEGYLRIPVSERDAYVLGQRSLLKSYQWLLKEVMK